MPIERMEGVGMGGVMEPCIGPARTKRALEIGRIHERIACLG
jgi:hypothetical protein